MVPQQRVHADDCDSDEGSAEAVPLSAADAAKYGWHLEMLNDGERVAKYRAAINATVAAASASSGSPISSLNVLDIGAGAGLLGLAAASCSGGPVRSVTAVESDPILAEITAENLSAVESVSVICAHSAELVREDVGDGLGADVIVSEILDSGLIGEDCLPTIRHARRELAREGRAPHVVPARAVVYAQLVQCATAWSWQHLSRERDPSLSDALASLKLPQGRGDGDANPHGICVDVFFRGGHLTPLSAPFRALDFDLADPPAPEGRTAACSAVATASGTLHGVLFWWRCALFAGDDGDATAIDTRPSCSASGEAGAEAGTRSHWRQAVSVLPAPARTVAVGDRFDVVASHTDEDIWFRVAAAARRAAETPSARKRARVEAEAAPPPQLPRAADSGGALGAALHAACGRERLAMLNDEARNRTLELACDRILQRAGCLEASTVVVDVGSGSLMASIVSQRHCRAVAHGTRGECGPRIISTEESAAAALLWQQICAANDDVAISIRLTSPVDEEAEERGEEGEWNDAQRPAEEGAAEEEEEGEGEEENEIAVGSRDNTAAMECFHPGRVFEDTPTIDVIVAEPYFAEAATA